MQNWLQVFNFPSVEKTTYDRFECSAKNQIYHLLYESFLLCCILLILCNLQFQKLRCIKQRKAEKLFPYFIVVIFKGYFFFLGGISQI